MVKVLFYKTNLKFQGANHELNVWSNCTMCLMPSTKYNYDMTVDIITIVLGFLQCLDRFNASVSFRQLFLICC